MRALKWLGGGVLLLALVLVGGGWLLGSDFKVTRSLLVNAPPEKIYPLVADPREWKQWSVWNQRDPAMAITYSGAPSGVGAVWAWRSATEGDGRMSFTRAEAPGLLAYDLYFPDFGTTSRGELRLVPEGNATRVSWTMEGNMGRNPLFSWIALFADGMVGKDFEAGLAGLKAVAEK
ncbi:hypothetical protein IP87_18985 [beta proteobacterium AAP121]|nr:hypothetical protein IP80_17510 [beta proteobacterium AAP65]KPF94472.1 hypothetical protein IP87_18985 [beta proteobacterium AAP121]